jgi:hypothetical protein
MDEFVDACFKNNIDAHLYAIKDKSFIYTVKYNDPDQLFYCGWQFALYCLQPDSKNVV